MAEARNSSNSTGGTAIVHETLKDLLLLERDEFGGMLVVSIAAESSVASRLIDRLLPSGWMRMAAWTAFRQTQIGWSLLFVRRRVLLMECFAAYAWALAPLLAFRRAPTFVLLMWDQQFASKSIFRRMALAHFRIWSRLNSNFTFLQTEVGDHVLPSTYRLPRNKCRVVRLPRRSDLSPLRSKGWRPDPAFTWTIGFGGKPRRGKQVIRSDVLDVIVRRFQKQGIACRVLVGTTASALDCPSDFPIELVKTDSDASYVQFLRRLDLFVLLLDESEYWYRSSGLAMDAAGAGATLLVPDFPVVKEQVEWPVRVGFAFGKSHSLEDATASAISHRVSFGSDSNWSWWEGRAVEKIADGYGGAAPRVNGDVTPRVPIEF